MKQQYLDLIPPAIWNREKDTKLSHVLTHDADGKITSALIMSVFPNDTIDGFYDFHTLSKRHYARIKPGNTLYVDATMTESLCIGNHPTYMYDRLGNRVINPNAATFYQNGFKIKGLGVPQSIHSYDDKYKCNSALFTAAILGINLDDVPDEVLMALLCVDGMYTTFFSNNKKWISKDTNFITEILGYPKLLQVLHNYKLRDFKDIEQYYNIHCKIYLDNGYLRSSVKFDELQKLFAPLNLDLTLSKDRFNKVATFAFEQHKYSTINKFYQDEYASMSWNESDLLYTSKLISGKLL